MTVEVQSESASRLHRRERVEMILRQLDQLPTLPALAVRLLGLTASAHSSTREVVEAIESDAGLSAAILRMVCRADLGVCSDAMTVSKAVTLLGFKTVRNAVLALEVHRVLPTASEEEHAAEIRRGLWIHSLAVACVADMLSEAVQGTRDGGEAYLGGLMHDIGKIALDARFPKSYARVADRLERERGSVCDIEHDLFGLDHTLAGKRLLTRWGMPAFLVECAWLHHQSPDALPSSVEHPRFVQWVHLANELTRRQRIGFHDLSPIDDLESLAADLGIDGEALHRIMDQLPQRMEPYCAMVGLDDVVSRTLYAESVVKANAELGRMNTHLQETNRQLAARSACLDALELLAELVKPDADVGDACTAAAGGVLKFMGGGAALAYFCDASNRCVYTSHVTGGDEAASVVVYSMDDPHDRDIFGALSMASSAVKGRCASCENGESIWQRCTGRDADGPVWMLPFAGAELGPGAVLLVAEEGVAERFASAHGEWAALAHGIAQAMATTRARLAAERMSVELLDLNRRLRATQQERVRGRSIAMVAEMAAGAAHELNNPLSVISGRAQLLLKETADTELQRALNIIVQQAQGASNIVAELMEFAKPSAPQPSVQRIWEALESLRQHWQTDFSLPADRLSLTLEDAEVSLYADPEQLRTILNEVVKNAVEASAPEMVRVEINSRSRASDETVRIAVRDRGAGMTPEVLEHAVDPFFSSRPAGRGRGLGLSRAYRLAEFNGGRLWIESTPQAGTTVTIELPARAPTA